MKLGRIHQLTIIAHSECPYCNSLNAHDIEPPVVFSQIVSCIFCSNDYEIKYSADYVTATGQVHIDETGLFKWIMTNKKKE